MLKCNYRDIQDFFPTFMTKTPMSKHSSKHEPQQERPRFVSNNKDIATRLNSSKHNKNLLQYFPNLRLDVVFESTSATVCVGTDSMYVMKLFKESDKMARIFKNEMETYFKIKECQNVCKLIDHYDSKELKYLILPYLGVDGLELINTDGFTFEKFLQLLETMIAIKEDLSKINIVHGDIKLENIAYNGRKWVLFDFGLAFSSKIKDPQLIGTVPYTLPQLSHKPSFIEYKQEILKGLDNQNSADYYAIALTLLNSLCPINSHACKICRDDLCDCKKPERCIFINIESLYAVLLGKSKLYMISDCREIPNYESVSEIVKILIAIVLSKIKVEYKYMTWAPGAELYSGRNKHYEVTRDKSIRKQTTQACWDDLKKLVKN